jgi:hypothetical protein
VRHFPRATLTLSPIRTQTPDQFLSDLFDAQPSRIAQIITEQTAALTNPPLTRDQVLTNLARVVPFFVQKVRDDTTANPG